MLVAVTATVLIVAVTVIILSRETALILTDYETGERYAAYELAEGEEFSVTFVHSVNKTPVSDVYELREDGIYLTGTVYYGFGAGVPTELSEGETLTYGDGGEMIISGMDTKMPKLIYVVGTVSDHVLKVGGREISLRELCGQNSKVLFEIKKVFNIQ